MLPRDWRTLAWISAAVVIASAPAWTGTWIYDDWHMRGNDLMDGLDDVLRVFGRTSVDYLKTSQDQAITGATYRPLAMLSLIAVQGISAEAPLGHHLLSVLLHLLCVAGRVFALKQRTHRSIAVAAGALFALHPVGIEAYGWINGRSDVLAGACLAWLAYAARSQANLRMRALCFSLALAAVLSKETAFVAVLGMLIAEALSSRGATFRETLVRARPAVVAGVAGAAAAVGVRAIAVGLSSAGAGAMLLTYESQPVTRVARLWAVALQTLVIPAPRTMKSLAWELSQPLTAGAITLLAAACLLLAAAAWKRQVRTVALVACAAVSLIPTLVVSHGFWQGLDRYLYMPAILLALAIAECLPKEREPRLRPSLARGALAAAGLGFALATFLSAGSYANQAAHFSAMIETRPDDPTGYLAGALWLWEAKEHETATALLERMPRTELPPPLASQLVTVLGRMGRADEALSVLANLHREHPNDPFVLYDVFAVSLSRGDFERAFAADLALDNKRMFCSGRRALVGSVTREHPEWTARIAAARATMECD